MVTSPLRALCGDGVRTVEGLSEGGDTAATKKSFSNGSIISLPGGDPASPRPLVTIYSHLILS
jgi:hypothetical protein